MALYPSSSFHITIVKWLANSQKWLRKERTRQGFLVFIFLDAISFLPEHKRFPHFQKPWPEISFTMTPSLSREAAARGPLSKQKVSGTRNCLSDEIPGSSSNGQWD